MFGLFKRQETVDFARIQQEIKTLRQNRKPRKSKWTLVRTQLDLLEVGRAVTVHLKKSTPQDFRVMLQTTYGPGIFKTKKLPGGKCFVLRLK